MIVVMVRKPTRPDSAEAPSLSRAMPMATPTANSRPKLSRIAEPVLTRYAETTLLPPQALGSIQ